MSPEPASLLFVERPLDRVVDPLDLLRLSPQDLAAAGCGGVEPTAFSPAPRFYFAPHDGAPTMAAVGAVARVDDVMADDAVAAMHRVDPEGRAAWVGGFAFDPLGRARRAEQPGDPWRGFPPALWWLPAVCVIRDGHDAPLRMRVAGRAAHVDRLQRSADRLAARLASRATESRVGAPDGAPSAALRFDPQRQPDGDSAVHVRLVRAIEAVRRGDASKVVLAAQQSLRLARAVDPVAWMAAVRAEAQACTAFFVEPVVGRVLLGATPERLLRLDGADVGTMALAGSAPRGQTVADDQAIGAALLASQKDRREHELVVTSIVAHLGEAGVEAQAPKVPRLRKLATIQHLETPISGRLRGQGEILSLAARLHPTPALGGEPPEAALALIRALEPEDRGWYGGAVGWRDGAGNGDLAVVIRALRVVDRTVTAFAGAGLVAASNPVSEREEIAMKFRAAFAPLGASVAGAAAVPEARR